MKKTTIFISIILCFSMIQFSCKTKKVNNSGCVTVIQNSLTTPVLPESEMNVIKSLFAANRMDDTKYQFYRLDKDDLGFTHVRSYQYVNGLRVFSADLIFHFNQNGAYYLLTGNLINSTGLDARPSLNPQKVAEIFSQRIGQEKASMVDATVSKGCFEIEFGYAGLDNSNEKFAKVWKVKPAGKDSPFAYINDENAEIIYYDNGVRY